MAIEERDPSTGRWILYRTDAQHSDDCRDHPFEDIPRRVFLDTNVVNLVVKHAEQVFERTPIPDNADPVRAEDIEALMHVFQIGFRANWDLVASRKTIEEIALTPNVGDREDLLCFANELLHRDREDRGFAEDFGRRLAGTPFVSALPDHADQVLLGNAVGYGCDAFCTRDRRTIVKYRNRLPDLPLRILTPLEWWCCIRPWAGLFL